MSIKDWDKAERAEQAQVIRTIVERVTVGPAGKGSGPKFRPERVSITYRV